MAVNFATQGKSFAVCLYLGKKTFEFYKRWHIRLNTADNASLVFIREACPY